MSDELNPCPFCGGEAHMPYYGAIVECWRCKATTLSIAAWQTRADDARIRALEAERDRLREALSRYDVIDINGKKYRKFIPFPEPVNDGTSRCIQCGQIDEPEYHDDDLCRAALEASDGAD